MPVQAGISFTFYSQRRILFLVRKCTQKLKEFCSVNGSLCQRLLCLLLNCVSAHEGSKQTKAGRLLDLLYRLLLLTAEQGAQESKTGLRLLYRLLNRLLTAKQRTEKSECGLRLLYLLLNLLLAAEQIHKAG